MKFGGPFWIDMAVPIFMILSGFTYSMSADRYKINTLQKWFAWSLFRTKLLRVVLPYFITIAIETVVFILVSPKSFREFVIGYCTGGWGPGSYYVLILIQLIGLFPLMFLLFKKSPVAAVMLSFGVHLCFDIVSNTIHIADWVYRLIIFRYVAFVVLGIILYHYKDNVMRQKCLLTALAALSAVYICICQYFGYVPLIFLKWTHTSLPTAFWAFGLVVLGFRYLEIKSNSNFAKMFSTIGQASYHIFLVQMVYFLCGLGKMGVQVNILICVVSGVMFYYFEAFILRSYRRLKLTKINSKSKRVQAMPVPARVTGTCKRM